MSDNKCNICDGHGKVKHKSQENKYKYNILECPICIGTGNVVWSKSQSKIVAHKLIYKLIKDAIHVGFHLDKIMEDNNKEVLYQLEKIQEKIGKQAGIKENTGEKV